MAFLKIGKYTIECMELPRELREKLSEKNEVKINCDSVVLAKGVGKLYAYNGKTLRELLVEATSGEYADDFMDYATENTVKLFDYIVDRLEKLWSMLRGGNKQISFEFVEQLMYMFELSALEKEVDWGILGYKDCTLKVDIDTYTVGKYQYLFNMVRKELNEKGKGIKIFSKFISANIDGIYFTACSNETAIDMYVNECIECGGDIPVEPLERFFNERVAEHPAFRHSYAACKNYAFHMENSIVKQIINNMYDISLFEYLNSEMVVYKLLRYRDGKMQMVDWSVEILDYDDLDWTYSSRNKLMYEALNSKELSYNDDNWKENNWYDISK